MNKEKETILLHFDAEIDSIKPKLAELKEILEQIQTLCDSIGISITVK